jgi:hypothetical protein
MMMFGGVPISVARPPSKEPKAIGIRTRDVGMLDA